MNKCKFVFQPNAVWCTCFVAKYSGRVFSLEELFSYKLGNIGGIYMSSTYIIHSPKRFDNNCWNSTFDIWLLWQRQIAGKPIF